MYVFFFIIIMVIIMKVYIDLLIIVNFIFDFILLSSVNYILKRRVKFYRIILGSVVGTISILFLFLPLSSITLFLLKIVTSILMVLSTFSYKSSSYFKKNFIYLYIISIVLGGVMYFLDITFNYKSNSLVFINSNFSLNFIVLIILGPLLLYFYLKENKNYRLNISLYKKVKIIVDDDEYMYDAYIDTGNKLKDPYKNRSIILVYDRKLKFNYNKTIFVPYNTLNNSGVIKCMKVDRVFIDDREIKNILVGEAVDEFHLDGVSCILPNIIKEDLSD